MTKAEQDREKKREWYKSLSEEQQVDYCLYCIEALAFTYRMVETSYCFLTDFRVKASENPSQVNGYPSALAEAWMFIDSYALFARMLDDSFFSIKTEDSVKQFLAFSEPIRECRNYHFHIEAVNQYQKSGDSLLMGNLSWVSDDGKCHIPFPDVALRKSKSSHSVVFDAKKGIYVSKLCLCVNNKSIDFECYYDQIRIIRDKLVAFFNDERISKLFHDCKYCITSLSFEKCVG
ncbi:MAG: hypothetical protein IKP61_00245 [Spirochaetales bacterium]|nr:hypothetical protein [Spirochaetales bacterium]